ncbi:MAG: glycoside hydrolase family 3 C-terminal domain-containing protein, partial [Kiritimatiellae bacterium]|nr:glycoside hydrolase family 3 C-terminal domain-containing protein [Kiritimatiellia bacterium]
MTSPASRRTVRACLAMIVAGLLMTSRLTASAAAPQDAGVQLEQKIEALLKKMTLEEKVSLLSGKDGGELKAIPRLGIPALRVTDGPHGVGWGTKSTAFPTGVSMGSTWNPALIAKVGVALGRETRAAGRHVLLGPCVCIHRTPLGGRNFESFAEDPYLAGKIAAAYVRGVQSQKIGTSTKHYACNNQEWERTTISVEVDERTLREIYLPAFRAAVEEGGTWTIMGAYNKVNGDYCCANRHLLTDILKKDWGFGGVVVSDWGATHSTLDSALAGLDLEMPGPGEFFSDALLKAARDGRVPGEVIDDKVRRILRVLAWCGLLDGSARSFKGAASTPEHQALCRRVAEEAIVLLKNAEGVLPLNRNAIKSIAVIGPNAAYARVGGGGSSTVTPPHTVSPLDGLRALCGEGMKVEYVQGVRFPTDMTIIEAKHLRPPAGVEGAFGLRGEYFSNRELEGEPVVTRLDRNVAFRWGDESPDPRVPADKFSARWTGKLVPPKSGTYRLGMSSDDGIRLYVDDELLVDHWVDHGPTIMLNDIALEAGREYDLRIEFHESAGGATAELGWALPDDGVLEQAVELARDCDAAVVCVGLTYEIEGEGVDRSTMHLPAGQ